MLNLPRASAYSSVLVQDDSASPPIATADNDTGAFGRFHLLANSLKIVTIITALFRFVFV